MVGGIESEHTREGVEAPKRLARRKELLRFMEGEFGQDHKADPFEAHRLAKEKSWKLLQATRMPAVRIEAGYVSNPHDAARLGDAGFRDAIAEGVVVALQRLYLGEQDTSATGVLQLGDLRKVLEELAG